MTIELMRTALSSVYPGDEWKAKVRDMHECQVISVYNSFLARDLIGRDASYSPPRGIARMTELKEGCTEFDEAIEKAKQKQLDFNDILKEIKN